MMVAMMEEKERLEELAESELRDRERTLEGGGHPHGVQPWGNSYEAGAAPSVRSSSLGHLRVLSDEALVDLLGHVGARGLCVLARSSKALYVLSQCEELWKPLVIAKCGGAFKFQGTWRRTYALEVCGVELSEKVLKVGGFYSDVLFQSFLCSTIDFDSAWLEVDNVDRRSGLSLEEFVAQYEKPNRPVIITDVVKKWPAFGKWNREYLFKEFGDTPLIAGAVKMKLADFFKYCDTSREERPLYIFDKHFSKHSARVAADYEVPEYFNQDLFSLLGEEGRPDYRWMIMGPGRSGSSFHVDPNSTSAWNACITGRKKWILYPPHCPPPGVHPSTDMAEVTTSASLCEWFINFYPQTKVGDVRPMECVCEAGEVIFVPRGWWHCVLNLEESVAITQNYVSERNLLTVVDYLRDKPHCISGTDRREDLLERFEASLKEKRPGLLEGLREEQRVKQQSGKSLWDKLTDKEDASHAPTFSLLGGGGGGAGAAGGAALFSFGF